MYSEQDMIDINRLIRRDRAALFPVLALFAAGMAAGLVMRVQALTTACAVLAAVAVIFIVTYCLLPKLRYRRFLTDMQSGLSREMSGTIVAIAEQSETQDGARVLPVRLLLDQEQDERIVYLNASKRDCFPGAGQAVKLRLYGRHIREVAAA